MRKVLGLERRSFSSLVSDSFPHDFVQSFASEVSAVHSDLHVVFTSLPLSRSRFITAVPDTDANLRERAVHVSQLSQRRFQIGLCFCQALISGVPN